VDRPPERLDDVAPHGTRGLARLTAVPGQDHLCHKKNSGGAHHRLRHERQRRTQSAKSAAPIGGPASWLSVMNPVCRRELASARSSRGTSIGGQRRRSVVGEHLGGAQDAERDQCGP
jgi:hypothetical protein